MQCTNCESVYQEPMPAEEKIIDFYPEDYGPYEQLGNLKQPSLLRLAVFKNKYGYEHLKVPPIYQLIAPIFTHFKYRDTIRFIPNGKALDIGCGNGEFMRTMNSLGWDFEGVEFGQVAVEACRAFGLKVFHGNLYEASFKDNSFNLITARHLIEHLADPIHFFKETTRILKKRGRFVIQTPNSQALGRRWFKTKWFANDVPRHLVLFSPANLQMLAENHGLHTKIIRTSSTPKIVLNSWDYLIENRGKPSKSKKALRLLARLYVIMAAITRRGDEIFAIFEKS